MLREARIIMPFFATALSLDVHRKLAEELCDAFGGFTATDGRGGWKAPDGSIVYDNVTIYDIAMDGRRDGGPYDALTRIATEAGNALHQQSVYVRYCNGVVDIIDIKSHFDKIDRAARETAEKGQRLLNELAREHGNDDDIKLLEAVFGKGNVFSLNAGEADEEKTDRKLAPGQLWTTRGGGRTFVGRRATVFGGGFYATLCDPQPGYRVGFEYVVGLDGRLGVDLRDGDTSSLDLVSFVA